jgi:hypothetical protein
MGFTGHVGPYGPLYAPWGMWAVMGPIGYVPHMGPRWHSGLILTIVHFSIPLALTQIPPHRLRHSQTTIHPPTLCSLSEHSRYQWGNMGSHPSSSNLQYTLVQS